MTEGKRAELLKAEVSAWSKRWRNTAPVSGWEWLRAVNVAHFILISLVIQLNAGGWTPRLSERCVPSSVSNWRESAQFISPVGLRTLCSADVIIQPFYYFSSFCVHKVMTQSDSPDADCWWFKARQWFHGRLFQATSSFFLHEQPVLIPTRPTQQPGRSAPQSLSPSSITSWSVLSHSVYRERKVQVRGMEGS